LYARVRAQKPGGAQVLWRARLVIRMDDPRRALATLRRLLAGSAMLGAETYEVTRQPRAKIARLFGAAPSQAGSVVRDLRRAGAIAIAALPGAFVAVRRAKSTLAIDLIRPFGGRAIAWQSDRNALLAALGKAPKKGFAPRLGRAAAER